MIGSSRQHPEAVSKHQASMPGGRESPIGGYAPPPPAGVDPDSSSVLGAGQSRTPVKPSMGYQLGMYSKKAMNSLFFLYIVVLK